MGRLFQQIEGVIHENKLIGNHDFTDNEYVLMLEYVNELCKKKHNFEIKQCNIIFVTLVEITKRWKDNDTHDEIEENSGFWNFVFKTLTGDPKFSYRLYYIFTSVIYQMDSINHLPIVKTGQKFYSTLMMHSFAPRDSVYSFFDLCYNVFKKDLDFGFTSNDEWLCEIVSEQMKNVLGFNYREDRLVSIGSCAYSIKIGLRSFVLNENLSGDFIKFIRDTFYNINRLFNRELIRENTRLERYIVDWWKIKVESEKSDSEIVRNKRVSTVSKKDIKAKYILNNNEALLCIPPIRLENNSVIRLLIYLNEELVYSEEMITKRGELVITTKQIEFKINNLVKSGSFNFFNLRVEILENGIMIFDSEKNKTYSLKREFILFDGEKEIFSQINKPTNYFIYSIDIDGLKSLPDELTTCGTNVYNIYPDAGESIIGETKQVFFVEKEKSQNIGTNSCLIGGLANIEWILDNIHCIVYKNVVMLIVPDNANLKMLELRIDNERYLLPDLNYGQVESNFYQFELKSLGLIFEYRPIKISLYSYEKEAILFEETIILLPDLEVQFNNPFYYGDIERKVSIRNNDDTVELSWNNHDDEIIFPLNEGVLVIKIPYLKWRINNNEWYTDFICKKIWYKNFIQNGDLLEIENQKEIDVIKVLGNADGKSFEIAKNKSGKFEIGRAIYANENSKNISISFSCGANESPLFNVSSKEHFTENPLIYRNGKVYWDVENSFIGEDNNDFSIIVKPSEKSNDEEGKKLGTTNIDLGYFDEDVYKVVIKIRDRNIFSNNEKYTPIFEGNLIVGKPEKFRFKNKRVVLLSANCCNSKASWVNFVPKYVIDELSLIQEQGTDYYIGRLCVIDENREIRVINTMLNESDSYDTINPVRIELRSNNTLWLVAGWEGESDFLGGLFLDKRRKDICNIAQQSYFYDEINLYKFKVEEDV